MTPVLLTMKLLTIASISWTVTATTTNSEVNDSGIAPTCAVRRWDSLFNLIWKAEQLPSMPVSQAHTAQRDNRNVPSTSRVVSVRTTCSLMRFKHAVWRCAQAPTTCSGVDLSWVPTVPSLPARLIPRRRLLLRNTCRALQHKPSIQATSVAQTFVRAPP